MNPLSQIWNYIWQNFLWLLLPFLLLFGTSGCVDVNGQVTTQEKMDAQAANLRTVIESLSELGVEVDVLATLSTKGYAGAFTGGMWDLGQNIQVHAKLSPEQAKLLAEYLKLKEMADAPPVDSGDGSETVTD